MEAHRARDAFKVSYGWVAVPYDKPKSFFSPGGRSLIRVGGADDDGEWMVHRGVDPSRHMQAWDDDARKIAPQYQHTSRRGCSTKEPPAWLSLPLPHGSGPLDESCMGSVLNDNLLLRKDNARLRAENARLGGVEDDKMPGGFEGGVRQGNVGLGLGGFRGCRGMGGVDRGAMMGLVEGVPLERGVDVTLGQEVD
ncbi:hypothetical protein T484DRAFT_1906894, partial [Baffinella frigidus]